MGIEQQEACDILSDKGCGMENILAPTLSLIFLTCGREILLAKKNVFETPHTSCLPFQLSCWRIKWACQMPSEGEITSLTKS